MRCYRDIEGKNGALEALYFAHEWEQLPRAMGEAGLFVDVPLENWDLGSINRTVAKSGWAVRFQCQMTIRRAAAAE